MLISAFLGHCIRPLDSLDFSFHLFSIGVDQLQGIIFKYRNIIIFQEDKPVCSLDNGRCITGNKIFAVTNAYNERAFLLRRNKRPLFFLYDAEA
jgi:hypothetical protein